MVDNTTFREDVNTFFYDHALLSFCTAGVAVGIYAVGNLCGRVVSWIFDCCQSTAQVDQIGREGLNMSAASQVPSFVPISVVVAPYDNHQVNLATLKTLRNVIFKHAKLPVDLIGEEHIAACLYAKLIDHENRQYIEILLPSPEGRIIPADYTPSSQTRFIFIPMSVNNNTHNTMLVIDRQNKVYGYFNSYNTNARISSENRALLIDRGLITDDFIVDVDKEHLEQRDRWSCGYFAIENAMQYLDVRPRGQLLGADLKNIYAPFFKAFVETHGTEPKIHNMGRVARRQKTRLRDALKLLVAENALLEPLYAKLVDELDPDSVTRNISISDFASRYLTENDDDLVASKVLGQCKIVSSHLSEILSREVEMMTRGENGQVTGIEKTEFEVAQLKSIEEAILLMLAGE